MHTEVYSLEERQLALRRALESRTFARSEQLKSFLRYICEAEMLRPGALLTEYVIGVEVFRRPEGYSPAEDSSVRTRAYELRQKLERLYTSELPSEPIQIFVPKGTYSPQFTHRAANVSKLAASHLEGEFCQSIRPSAVNMPRHHPAWMATGVALLIALVALSVGWRIGRSPIAAMPDRVLSAAWGALADHDRTALLCLATPLTLAVGPKGHEVFGSKDYPAPDETYAIFREHRPLGADEKLGLTFTDNMIAVGTLNATLLTTKVLGGFGTSYQILPERAARISALRGRNVVLFGAPVDSEAVALELADMPLVIDFEPSVREFVVRDRTVGTYIVPKKTASGDFSDVFGLVTVKMTEDSDGRPVETVVFSGITSAGVQGAAEYFSSPSALTQLRGLFRKEGTVGFPSRYQVVVRCTYKNQLLLSADYYMHRVSRKTGY